MTDKKTDPPPKKLGIHTCTRCKKNIECTSKDPVNMTSLGIFHNACMKATYQEIVVQEAKKEAEKATKKTEKKIKKKTKKKEKKDD